jgi:hypothetical protein
MRVNVAKVGMEVADKITGIVYRIDNTTDDPANATVTKAEATEILDEDEEREPKKVVIDASNDLTFRVTRWVADTTMYSATVVNGILTVNGKDVVMGSIVAKNVIKTFPGTVVFTAEDENLEAKDAVYEYVVSRDKMNRLGAVEQAITVVEDTDTRSVYGFSITKEVEEQDGDKTVKKTVFDRAGLYVLTKGTLDYKSMVSDDEDYDYDEDFEDEDDEDRDGECSYTDAPDGFLGYDFSKVVIAQGDKYFYIPVIDNEKQVTYEVYRITNVARVADTVTMPGYLTDVTSNNTSARNLGRVIFSGEGFVKIDNVVIRSNELKGFIYLVDAQRDQANDVNTYVLSTGDRKLKKITRKNTPDRGEIITIE